MLPSMPRFPYAPTEGANLGAGMRGGLGCGAIIVAIFVIGAISTVWENDKAAKRELGPIPLRFQGAYNSISCQSISRHMDGLVTIGDDEIRFPFGSFTPTEVISESDDRITFRWRCRSDRRRRISSLLAILRRVAPPADRHRKACAG